MSATNTHALGVNPGIVEVAPYVSTLPVLLNDNSNAVAVKSALDALTYVRIASVTDVKLMENYGEKGVEIITDDNGTIYKSVAPSVTIKGNWYEAGDVDAVKALVGKTVLNVAASPVTVTGEAKGTGWTIGTPIKLNYKDGDNTIVQSIVVKVNGVTKALGTDYTTFVGDGTTGLLGYTYIVGITAQTLAVTVDYSYNPNASKYTGSTIQNTQLPNLVVRITSTDAVTSKVKTQYLVNSNFDGEIVSAFLDVARAGEIAVSPFSFSGNRKGQVLQFTDDV